MDAADRLYGAQTALAIENFPISGRPMDVRVVRALAEVKVACARVNADAGVVAADIATAIEIAALAVARGQQDDQFPVDTFQTGSGTSTNMNVNEVVATIASRASGIAVHPNDHVNASQSSNDAFPTAVHVALARVLVDLRAALVELQSALAERGAAFADVAKPGRTHLMDAVPVTLGQEFAGYARQVERGIALLDAVLPHVLEVPLGGSAVGTGLNTPPGFRAAAVSALAAATGLPLTPASNGLEAQATRDGLVAASGVLRGIAVALTKICNDLRLMASGPTAGLGEIVLPALQAGSSIMPGKVNPVIPEAVLQVCARVIGNDATVAWAGASGSFELNVQMPVMVDALLDSATLLERSVRILATRCIAGVTADAAANTERAAESPAIITALNQSIGYERGAALVAQAADEGISTRALVQRLVVHGELPPAALEALDPLRAAYPHGRHEG